MRQFPTLDNILWAAGFVGDVVLVAVLVKRGCVRVFPVFTLLQTYQALGTITLFLVSLNGTPHAYFVVYWSLAPGDYAFQVALIFEIARIVLRPTGAWIRDARAAFLLWSMAGTFVAAGISLAIALPNLVRLDLWAARATIFTSLLTCMMFLAMSTAADRLGLLWKNHVMALGQGLTAWALVALLGNVLQFGLGWRKGIIFDRLEMLVYVGALGFWIVSFWRPERERGPLSIVMQAYLTDLHGRVARDLEDGRKDRGTC